MGRAPLIIPLFIPHQGCPHRCVFCDQGAITGATAEHRTAPGPAEIAREIRTWLARSPRRGRRVMAAFYGGSFTALPRSRQEALLAAAWPFLDQGLVDCLRLSTRPDCVDAATTAFLSRHGVREVEIGAQALDDSVLAAARRGHTVADVEQAILHLRAGGMRVGAQLMIGLPGETRSTALAGARRLAALKPDFVRLYPLVVLAGTPLAAMYHAGEFTPPDLLPAVALAARMTEIFTAAGVKIVRIGLPWSESLQAALVAGPLHPAFGELVRARVLFRRLRRELRRHAGPPVFTPAERSLLLGRKACTLKRLTALGLLDKDFFPPYNNDIPERHIKEFP